MASTYTYQDVLNVIRHGISAAAEDRLGATICNVATSFIWNAYDFRETIDLLPPVFLIPNEQDLGKPFSAVPSDFNGLRQMYLVRLLSDPPVRMELKVVKDVRLTHVQALPHAVGYQPDRRSIRVFPRVPDNVGAPDFFIEGTYKKKPKMITANTLGDLLPFDDQYFPVWIEVAKWAAWSLTNDSRAGGISINGDQRIYVGQAAVAKEAVDSMAKNEGLNEGDPTLAPDQPLIPIINFYPFRWTIF